MGWESCEVVRFDLWLSSFDLKNTYNLLIFGLRGLQCETAYRISWAGNLLMWSDLTLGLSFKVKRG